MARIIKRSISEVHHHTRGWGREVWIENIPEYCGKILYINKGKRCSTHFHMLKSETMFLDSGHVNIVMIDPESGKCYVIDMKEGDSLFIPSGQTHFIKAIEDSKIIEFSTMHHEDDSYRVEKGD